MVFLPGNHALDINITVANIARLTMCGKPTSGNRAPVVCSGLVGLSFTSMVDFKIDSLAFISCSMKYAFGITLPGVPVANKRMAMFMQSTQYAEVGNCSFHDNLGTGLEVNNTNITLSGNSFTHNRALCGGIVMAAGAIIILDSNLTFTEGTIMLNTILSR